LSNTAVEFGPEDPSGAGFVQRYFDRLAKAFHAALKNACKEGALVPSVDPKKVTAFFTASVLGMCVMLRAKAPPMVIQSAASVALEHLEGLQPGSEALQQGPPQNSS